jgi:hypothetical protein
LWGILICKKKQLEEGGQGMGMMLSPAKAFLRELQEYIMSNVTKPIGLVLSPDNVDQNCDHQQIELMKAVLTASGEDPGSQSAWIWT